MSAALQTISDFSPLTLLDQLSNADPTSADLRARAAFWRPTKPAIGERRALPGAGVADIVAYQILADKQHRERAMSCDPSYPRMEA